MKSALVLLLICVQQATTVAQSPLLKSTAQEAPESVPVSAAAESSEDASSVLPKIKPAVAQTVSKATVIIETPNGSGSGFFYREGETFWIVSDTQIIGGAFNLRDLKVHDQDGNDVSSEPSLKADLEAGLCMLQLAKDYTPPAFLVSGKEPSPGDPVWVAGNAKGAGLIALRDGTIKALGSKRGVPIFEVSMPVVPGGSGGPVVNEDGELLGVFTQVTPVSDSLKSDTMFRETSSVRRMAVRSTRLSNLKPFEASLLYLQHKATRDRKAILILYLDGLAGKDVQPMLRSIRVYLAAADKPIMGRRMFAGVRESGMLDDYFGALQLLLSLNDILAKREDRIEQEFTWAARRRGFTAEGRISGFTPREVRAIFDDKTAQSQKEWREAEKGFLKKLQTKKAAVFVDQELHEAIDRLIEERLQAAAPATLELAKIKSDNVLAMIGEMAKIENRIGGDEAQRYLKEITGVSDAEASQPSVGFSSGQNDQTNQRRSAQEQQRLIDEQRQALRDQQRVIDEQKRAQQKANQAQKEVLRVEIRSLKSEIESLKVENAAIGPQISATRAANRDTFPLIKKGEALRQQIRIKEDLIRKKESQISSLN